MPRQLQDYEQQRSYVLSADFPRFARAFIPASAVNLLTDAKLSAIEEKFNVNIVFGTESDTHERNLYLTCNIDDDNPKKFPMNFADAQREHRVKDKQDFRMPLTEKDELSMNAMA